MTKNQIAYHELKESQRAHRASEGLEASKQAETKRSDLRNEELKQNELGIAFNKLLNVEMVNAKTNQANAQTNARNADTRQAELDEAIIKDWVSEQQRQAELNQKYTSNLATVASARMSETPWSAGAQIAMRGTALADILSEKNTAKDYYWGPVSLVRSEQDAANKLNTALGVFESPTTSPGSFRKTLEYSKADDIIRTQNSRLAAESTPSTLGGTSRPSVATKNQVLAQLGINQAQLDQILK